MKSTDTVKKKYSEIIDALKTQRDELQVKMHLVSVEVGSEWEDVEAKWEHLKSKEERISKEVGKSAHEVGDAISILGHEINEAYRRIRNVL